MVLDQGGTSGRDSDSNDSGDSDSLRNARRRRARRSSSSSTTATRDRGRGITSGGGETARSAPDTSDDDEPSQGARDQLEESDPGSDSGGSSGGDPRDRGRGITSGGGDTTRSAPDSGGGGPSQDARDQLRESDPRSDSGRGSTRGRPRDRGRGVTSGGGETTRSRPGSEETRQRSQNRRGAGSQRSGPVDEPTDRLSGSDSGPEWAGRTVAAQRPPPSVAEEVAADYDQFGPSDFWGRRTDDGWVVFPSDPAVRREAAAGLEGVEADDIVIEGWGEDREISVSEERRREIAREQIAAETGLEPSDIERVEQTDDGWQPVLTDDAQEERVRDAFFSSIRQDDRPAGVGLDPGAGGATSELTRFDEEDFDFNIEDGEATVQLSEEAVREDIRQRTAEQAGDRFNPEDVAIVGTEDGLEGRIPQSAITESLRTDLAEQEGVDPDDVIVEEQGDGQFVARVDDSPDPILTTDVHAERLLDPDADGPVIEADVDTGAAEERAGPLGPVVAASAVPVAVPEPASSVGGATIAGVALAAGAAYEASRRGVFDGEDDPTDSLTVTSRDATAAAPASAAELEISEGDATTPTRVRIGDQTTATEVGMGAGATETEVGLGQGVSSTEVEAGQSVSQTELEVTGGSESTRTPRETGDSVVPSEYPLPGRDFPASRREDAAQRSLRRDDYLRSLETTTVVGRQVERGSSIEQVRERRRQRRRDRELQEILEGPGEVVIGEETGRSWWSRRRWPTGAGSVIGLGASEEALDHEGALEPQVEQTGLLTLQAPGPSTGLQPRVGAIEDASTGVRTATGQAQAQEPALAPAQATGLAAQTATLQEPMLLQQTATGNPFEPVNVTAEAYGYDFGYGYGTGTPTSTDYGLEWPDSDRSPTPDSRDELWGSGIYDSGLGDLDDIPEEFDWE